MKISLEAVYHDESGEPYMKVDLVTWDRGILLYKLWWLAKCWRRLDLTLVIEKKAAK